MSSSAVYVWFWLVKWEVWAVGIESFITSDARTFGTVWSRGSITVDVSFAPYRSYPGSLPRLRIRMLLVTLEGRKSVSPLSLMVRKCRLL